MTMPIVLVESLDSPSKLGSCFANATFCNGTSCVAVFQSPNATLGRVVSTVLTVMMAFVMLSLGCNVEARKMWIHIKKPWGVFVGFVCQFGIMPLTGYLLSVAFNIKPLQAIAVVIMGCCPGGSVSNVLSYWVDGDMDLSIGMTTCSTILAMGMMPLCLYLYTSSWTSESGVSIPFQSIGITLASLLIPVMVGMIIKSRWPKVARVVLRIGSICGAVLIIAIAVVGGALHQGSWASDPDMWLIGFLFPCIGYVLGFILARLVNQPWFRCRTIALETGSQNSQLCTTILQLSFTSKQLDLMFTFPLFYSIFQLGSAFLMAGAYLLYKRKYPESIEKAGMDEEDFKKEPSKVADVAWQNKVHLPAYLPDNQQCSKL
uniref:ileal sodium/bile acid cotransporter n=1 Tax=Myxine glutinosa TaxID=7769 RepID=UPI00358E377E